MRPSILNRASRMSIPTGVTMSKSFYCLPELHSLCLKSGSNYSALLTSQGSGNDNCRWAVHPLQPCPHVRSDCSRQWRSLNVKVGNNDLTGSSSRLRAWGVLSILNGIFCLSVSCPQFSISVPTLSFTHSSHMLTWKPENQT